MSLQHQHNVLHGKCGICGDPYDAKVKEHEAPNGKYANGIIVKDYPSGGIMDVDVQVTSNHKGYFLFKLCPNNDIGQDPYQECFDKFPVKIYPNGEDRYYLPDEQSRDFKLQVQLPEIQCEQCILQWTYIAGNNWGTDESGSCVGCGPQETFRACSDIKISGQNDEPTGRPDTTIEPPEQTTTTTTTTTTTDSNENVGDGKCHAVGAWSNVAGMDAWCQTNCPTFCPSDHCQCN